VATDYLALLRFGVPRPVFLEPAGRAAVFLADERAPTEACRPLDLRPAFLLALFAVAPPLDLLPLFLVADFFVADFFVPAVLVADFLVADFADCLLELPAPAAFLVVARLAVPPERRPEAFFELLSELSPRPTRLAILLRTPGLSSF